MATWNRLSVPMQRVIAMMRSKCMSTRMGYMVAFPVFGNWEPVWVVCVTLLSAAFNRFYPELVRQHTLTVTQLRTLFNQNLQTVDLTAGVNARALEIFSVRQASGAKKRPPTLNKQREMFIAFEANYFWEILESVPANAFGLPEQLSNFERAYGPWGEPSKNQLWLGLPRLGQESPTLMLWGRRPDMHELAGTPEGKAFIRRRMLPSYQADNATAASASGAQAPNGAAVAVPREHVEAVNRGSFDIDGVHLRIILRAAKEPKTFYGQGKSPHIPRPPAAGIKQPSKATKATKATKRRRAGAGAGAAAAQPRKRGKRGARADDSDSHSHSSGSEDSNSEDSGSDGAEDDERSSSGEEQPSQQEEFSEIDIDEE